MAKARKPLTPAQLRQARIEERAEYERRTLSSLDYWMGRYNIRHWSLKVTFEATKDTSDPSLITYASICTDDEYHNLRLRIYPEHEKLSNSQQEAKLVHELAHALTEHVSNLAEGMIDGTRHVSRKELLHAVEQLTERIALAMIGQRSIAVAHAVPPEREGE